MRAAAFTSRGVSESDVHAAFSFCEATDAENSFACLCAEELLCVPSTLAVEQERARLEKEEAQKEAERKRQRDEEASRLASLKLDEQEKAEAKQRASQAQKETNLVVITWAFSGGSLNKVMGPPGTAPPRRPASSKGAPLAGVLQVPAHPLLSLRSLGPPRMPMLWSKCHCAAPGFGRQGFYASEATQSHCRFRSRS